jgi:hypothetical protein
MQNIPHSAFIILHFVKGLRNFATFVSRVRSKSIPGGTGRQKWGIGGVSSP